MLAVHVANFSAEKTMTSTDNGFIKPRSKTSNTLIVDTMRPADSLRQCALCCCWFVCRFAVIRSLDFKERSQHKIFAFLLNGRVQKRGEDSVDFVQMQTLLFIQRSQHQMMGRAIICIYYSNKEILLYRRATANLCRTMSIVCVMFVWCLKFPNCAVICSWDCPSWLYLSPPPADLLHCLFVPNTEGHLLCRWHYKQWCSAVHVLTTNVSSNVIDNVFNGLIWDLCMIVVLYCWSDGQQRLKEWRHNPLVELMILFVCHVLRESRGILVPCCFEIKREKN